MLEQLWNEGWTMYNWGIGAWMALFAGIAFVAASFILLNGPSTVLSTGPGGGAQKPPKPIEDEPAHGGEASRRREE